ncbi:MFS family permease [Sphingopyxis sp. OAS728]|uniref:MFS transporter n=1 Tax=Sphingopyxis sp. OAS728 TaxID=2663823 RepID=UPI00178B9F3E|nr:MFS transporter [Sphingopyxis sp. OAS728]MBE1526919.1 MFS family permease [Sphingopyxis sp. OAS728]
MLAPQAKISEDDLETGLRRLVVEALFSNTTAALTTGVVLTAFALHLGANNATIGLLAAIPFLTQLAQVPAIALVSRLRQRKRIAVFSSIFGRTMLGVMALAPFAGALGLPIMVAATFVLCALGAVGGCAWNSWLRDLAPEERMGRIFARRTFFATLTTLIAGVAAAAALELTPAGGAARDWSFAALYATGCAAGLASAWIVARIPEPQMPRPAERSLHLLEQLRMPFRDRNFARLIAFLGTWQFAINFATPFFTVYLVRQLGYDMTVVMGLSIASQLANAFALRGWGALADRFANKSVLLVAAPAYIACIVAMAGASQFEDDAFRLVWLGALHILMGGAVAGVTLATANIALKLSPRGEAASYLAASAVVTAVAAGSAPILGGALADFFAARQLELVGRWTNPDGVFTYLSVRLGSWDFYFLLSALLGLYALHRLGHVEETGEASREEVLRQLVKETRGSIHNFSTVTGLKALTDLPAGLVREIRVRQRFFRIRAAGMR